MKFLDEDWSQWRDGKWCENGDEDEDCLVDNDDGFPCGVPILRCQVSECRVSVRGGLDSRVGHQDHC